MKNMEPILELVQKFRILTTAIEPLWTIALVPIWQEIVFRYLPFQFWYLTNNFWWVGIASSIIFALIHWYFGGLFVLAAFFAGLLYWWAMVEFGLVGAILIHVVVNILDLTFGIRQFLSNFL